VVNFRAACRVSGLRPRLRKCPKTGALQISPNDALTGLSSAFDAVLLAHPNETSSLKHCKRPAATVLSTRHLCVVGIALMRGGVEIITMGEGYPIVSYSNGRGVGETQIDTRHEKKVSARVVDLFFSRLFSSTVVARRSRSIAPRTSSPCVPSAPRGPISADEPGRSVSWGSFRPRRSE
jgi:hypothetical protein